jgi:CubicO group peptidase (beta-lactamase class C family)
MRTIQFVTLLVTSLMASAAGSLQTDRAARVDEIFKEYSRPGSPGCAVGVYQDDKIALSRAYGMANLDHDIPLTPSSVFHVASVSKQFTAAAILLLAQDGKLSLDDEVRKHVAELPDFGKPVTIRHLLNHTGGIRDQWTLLGLGGWRYSRDLITDADVLSLLSKQKELNFAPGERHLYSNSGFTLLAVIVSRASGKTFHDFTTERIFAPLGMTHTHFRDNFNEIVKNQAYGYARQRDTFVLSTTNFDTAGATSLLTTVEDMSKWFNNFDSHAVGGQRFADALLERGVLSNGQRIDYASGITHGTYRGVATVGHGGADAGYRATFVRFPQQRFGVSVLCNLAQSNPGELANRVADVYLADVLKPVTTPAVNSDPEVPVPEEELKKLAGMYWNDALPGARRFVFENGRLQAAASPTQRIPLKSLGSGRFVLTAPPGAYVTFEGDTARTGAAPTGGDVFTRAAPFAPSATELAAYAGIYRSDEIEPSFQIVLKKDRLVLERLKATPAELDPLVADTFSSQAGVIKFTRDAQGRVTGFVLEAGRIRGMKFWKDTRSARPSSL